MNDADVGKLHSLAYDLEDLLKEHKGLQRELRREQERNRLLVSDKYALTEELDEIKHTSNWRLISDGEYPDNVRVLVKSKQGEVAFGQFNGAMWLSGRMLLDLDPVYWMRVPE